MTKTKTHWTSILVKAGACPEGLKFARKFSSFQECWDACENPEWLFWWIGKCIGTSNDSSKALVRCTCEIAEFVLPIFEKEFPKDRRPRKAIQTTLAWTEGKASLEEVRKAARAAYVAANAAYYADLAAAYVIGGIVVSAKGWELAKPHVQKAVDLLKIPFVPGVSGLVCNVGKFAIEEIFTDTDGTEYRMFDMGHGASGIAGSCHPLFNGKHWMEVHRLPSRKELIKVDGWKTCLDCGSPVRPKELRTK